MRGATEEGTRIANDKTYAEVNEDRDGDDDSAGGINDAYMCVRETHTLT